MLFDLQVPVYQGIIKTLGAVGKLMPIPKPTLFTGPESSLELCNAIAQTGTEKLLIVTDEVLIKLGVVDKIMKRLEEQGVEYVVFDKVLPDPTFAQVEAGLKVFQDTSCTAILAVGGGSPIDCSKAMAARAANPTKSVAQLAGIMKVRKAPVPLFAIPTTAGTGSEVTAAAVVSDPESHKKNLLIDHKLVPLMAAIDGTLMTGLPPMVTAATGMDALTHAVEAYISVIATEDTDRYARAAVKLIFQNLETCAKDGKNLEARQNMANASLYAGLAFTTAGLGYVHAIAHNFGAIYHTPHGLANSIVLPHVLDYSKDNCTDRLADLAEIAGLKTGSESNEELATKFIAAIRDMMTTLNIPKHLDDLQVSDIPRIADAALKEAHGMYPVPKYMDKDACEDLIHKMVAIPA